MNKSRKIGIITMFHDSNNYGGLLQAYALVTFLKKNGYEAEQIRYVLESSRSNIVKLKMLIKKILISIKDLMYPSIKYNLQKRNKIIKRDILELVPHSSKVYTEKNIYKANEIYTDYITGSDQVWSKKRPAFYLTFANNCKKIAYAVSTGDNSFNKDELEFVKNNINDFSSISVREEENINVFQKLYSKGKIEHVLDPTLLLDENDWNKVCKERKMNEEYIFCYFLSGDKKLRDFAKKYSQKYNLKIVTIPHMQNHIERNDICFSDFEDYEATIGDFLTYIKFAKIVFTDSFHASVFSNIFGVNFLVFGRNEHPKMINRIETLLSIFNNKDRLVSEKYDFFDIERIASSKIESNQFTIKKLRASSERFLIEALRS